MKKFLNSKVSKYFFYMLLVVVFYSCEPNKQTLKNFNGYVLYEKTELLNGGKRFTLIKNETIKEVFVFTLDYRLYQIGDTIK
tara:strand:+ start:1966 stop:2211 length:246 start_codon:yes stop_codon:yes gene_type:complete